MIQPVRFYRPLQEPHMPKGLESCLATTQASSPPQGLGVVVLSSPVLYTPQGMDGNTAIQERRKQKRFSSIVVFEDKV